MDVTTVSGAAVVFGGLCCCRRSCSLMRRPRGCLCLWCSGLQLYTVSGVVIVVASMAWMSRHRHLHHLRRRSRHGGVHARSRRYSALVNVPTFGVDFPILTVVHVTVSVTTIFDIDVVFDVVVPMLTSSSWLFLTPVLLSTLSTALTS